MNKMKKRKMRRKIVFYGLTSFLLIGSMSVILEKTDLTGKIKDFFKKDKIDYQDLNDVVIEINDKNYKIKDLYAVKDQNNNIEFCREKDILIDDNNKTKMTQELGRFGIEYCEDVEFIEPVDEKTNKVNIETKDLFVVSTISDDQVYMHDYFDKEITPSSEEFETMSGYFSVSDNDLVLPAVSGCYSNYLINDYEVTNLSDPLVKYASKEDIKNGEVTTEKVEEYSKKYIKSLYR